MGLPPPYPLQMRPKMFLNLIGVRWEPPYTYYLVQYLARRIKWDLPFPGQGSQCRARGGRQSCIVSSWLNIILAGWLAGWLAGCMFLFQTPCTVHQTNLPPHRCSKRALFGFDMFGLFLMFFCVAQTPLNYSRFEVIIKLDLYTNPSVVYIRLHHVASVES